MNWVRCFLSMPGMLAGHRPNGRAVACYRRLSCDRQLIYKRTLALEKPVSLEKKDWLVQKFGLRRPQRLDSSLKETKFRIKGWISIIQKAIRKCFCDVCECRCFSKKQDCDSVPNCIFIFFKKEIFLTDKLICHFQIPKTLTFKLGLGAQPFLWKWVSFALEWKIISISKAEHLASFWNRGPRELRNGLLEKAQELRLTSMDTSLVMIIWIVFPVLATYDKNKNDFINKWNDFSGSFSIYLKI